jgi:hypothetical protein
LLIGGRTCSCVLIKPDRVITAGHCTDGHTWGYVYFGSVLRGAPEEISHKIVNATLHPNYISSGRTAQYDLSIGNLEERYDVLYTNNIWPIRLPTDNILTYENNVATTSGFGQTVEGTDSQYLNFATMTVTSKSDCFGDDFLICGRSSSASTCFADSGGALVYAEDGDYRLIGITGRISSGDCTSSTVSRFARVSQHLDWIKSI